MRLFLTLLICTISLSAFAADSRDDGTWEFVTTIKSAAEESISVRIVTGRWEPTEHKLEKREGDVWKVITQQEDLDYSKPFAYRIDGRESTLGADGFGWPEREVKVFVVKWGERVINIPRKHLRDYYGLLLYTVEQTKKDDSKGGCWTKAEFDPKSGELVVVSNGGGGAGWYRATWRIKSDGTIGDSAEALAE
jgi:hypothetical protein